MESQSSLTEADVVMVAPSDDEPDLQRLEDDMLEASTPLQSGAVRETVERSPVDTSYAAKPSPFKHLGLLRASRPWTFNNFLCELGNHISQDELHKLKHLFVDEIGKCHLEKIKIPEELFTKMRESSFLSENNLLYLQAILKTLNRPELIEMTIEHSKKVKSVLHFAPASEEPVIGYRYVKFHLFPDKDYCIVDLRRLQDMISGILGVPAEFVLIAGVEPTSSLHVTVMMPDMYAEILEKYLDRKMFSEELVALNIDTVYIKSKTFYIKDEKTPATKTMWKDSPIICTLYNDLENKTVQLDVLNTQHEELKKKCKQLENECARLQTNARGLKSHTRNKSCPQEFDFVVVALTV